MFTLRSSQAAIGALALFLLSGCASIAVDEGCAAAGVRIDADFIGGGNHRCLEAAPGRFSLSVDPEDEPINPSPWFAFRARANASAAVEVTLRYGNADHRYVPKVSTDGLHWRALSEDRLIVDDEADTATLTLDLHRGTTWIAAQPIETPAQTLAWARRTLAPAGFEEVTYGQSVDGQPLIAFVSGGDGGDGMIVAMTRQHPPETTGARAFQAFVEALVADSAQARDLIARHRIVLAPMPNPDGVARGHWRHNAGGVDLNRDWNALTQPEIIALTALIQREATGRRVVAFIDFHSTQRSVVYAPPLDAPSPTIGFLPFLEQQFNERASHAPRWSYGHDENSGVSKAWALERLGAPGITLELADTATAEEMQSIGAVTAEALAAYFSSNRAQ